MKLKLLSDFVMVRPIPDIPVSSGGITIPEVAKDPLFANQKATVVAMSREAKNGLGFHVLIGSTVVVSKFGGTVVKVDGEELKLYRAIEILAVIE